MTGPRLDPWSQTPYRPPYQGQHRAPRRRRDGFPAWAVLVACALVLAVAMLPVIA